MVRVLPGVLLTLARPLRFSRELIKDDFPTIDRPTKATSGRRSSGNCSGPSQLLLNSVDTIFMAWIPPFKRRSFRLRAFSAHHKTFAWRLLHTHLTRVKSNTRRALYCPDAGLLLITGACLVALASYGLATAPGASRLRHTSPS